MNAHRQGRDPARMEGEARLLGLLRALWISTRTAVSECEETNERVLCRTEDDPAPSPEAVAFIRETVLEHARAAARAADLLWGSGVGPEERELSRILHVAAFAYAVVEGFAAGLFADRVHPLFISVEESVGAAYRDLLARVGVDHAA